MRGMVFAKKKRSRWLLLVGICECGAWPCSRIAAVPHVIHCDRRTGTECGVQSVKGYGYSSREYGESDDLEVVIGC